MLTETAYFLAMLTYLVAGLLASLLGARWLAKRRAWRVAWFLTGTALLLTPAFPTPGMDTLAPASIVAGFQLATAGVQPAMHALRPLAVTLSAAWLLTLMAAAVLWQRDRR